MKNLVIDRGNTLSKWAIYDSNGLISDNGKLKSNNTNELIEVLRKYSFIENVILSSVIESNTDLENCLGNVKNTILLDFKTKIPIKNRYLTPQTLGLDRLASVIGANKLFPYENNLVIDLGTCVKFDFIDKNGEYFGGNISPGMSMRFASLNAYTDKLPLLSFETVNEIYGKSTKEAIINGVIQGITEEIKGTITLFMNEFGKINIIITGGDISVFEKRLNIPIFADSNLVLYGLNSILEYNLTK